MKSNIFPDYKSAVPVIEDLYNKTRKHYCILQERNYTYTIVGLQYAISNVEHLPKILMSTNIHFNTKLNSYYERFKKGENSRTI